MKKKKRIVIEEQDGEKEGKNGGKGLERRTGNGFEEKEGNMD
jgi:hypothetical protein